MVQHSRRELNSCILAMPAALFAAPAMAQDRVDDDVTRVRDRFAAYLETIAALSEEGKPPGINAANFNFTNALANDPLLKTAAAPVSVQTSEGVAIQGIFQEFARAMRNSFNAPGASGSWTGSRTIPIEIAEGSYREIIRLAGAVYDAYARGGNASDEDVQKRYKALATRVKALGIVTGGTHANGHISNSLHNTSGEVQIYTAAKLGEFISSSRGRKLAFIVRAMTVSLMSLPTDNHKPWLRGDWQLGFEAIIQTGAAGVRRI